MVDSERPLLRRNLIFDGSGEDSTLGSARKRRATIRWSSSSSSGFFSSSALGSSVESSVFCSVSPEPEVGAASWASAGCGASGSDWALCQAGIPEGAGLSSSSAIVDVLSSGL